MRTSFGDFILDSNTHQLTKDGREIHLSLKAFELLSTLVRARPKVLSKAELQRRLWPDTFVVAGNLPNLIAEIRDALDDSARKPRLVRTVHGLGYAFSGDARDTSDAERSTPERPSCWLEWNGRRFPLASGENVIGRDRDAEVRLDMSTVSRRHARVIVSDHDAVLEDLGSKNGTSRANEHVRSATPLADGDLIGIGSLVVTFHRRADLSSTETK